MYFHGLSNGLTMETVAEESIHLSREFQDVDFRIGATGPDNDLIETTRRHLNQLTGNSKLFEKLPPVPRLNPNEIQIGDVLGAGEFGLVCLVESINMPSNGHESISSLMRSAAAAAESSFCKVDQFDLSNSFGHRIDFQIAPQIEPDKDQFGKSYAASSMTLTMNAMLSFEVSSSSLPDFTEATFDDDFDQINEEELDELDDAIEQLDYTGIPRQLSRANLAASTRRNGLPRYALKAVKPNIGKDKRRMAILDLASEACFLRALHHTNIIRLRATVGVPGTPDYGLFLDRLTCTLQEKINSWAEEHGVYSQLYASTCSCQQPPVDMVFFRERLVVCLDIARALCHIHNHSVVYRDLKTDNIGFNVRGHIQIFDFGLAKEFDEKDKLGDEAIYKNATGLTGSRRYMAPEVVLCEPYGLSVDVYSYGLVFWQVFALEKPFTKYRTLKQFTDGIVHKRRRPPKLEKLLPESLQKLMSDSWAHDWKQRPSFPIICRKLQQELWMWQKYGKDDEVSDRTQYLRQNSWRSFKNSGTLRRISIRSLFASSASSFRRGSGSSVRRVSSASSKNVVAS